MKIEELIAGKKDDDAIQIEGASIPARALKQLMKDDYAHLKADKQNNTFSLWGQTCCDCLTGQQVRVRS
jgi:hypothetical protein